MVTQGMARALTMQPGPCRKRADETANAPSRRLEERKGGATMHRLPLVMLLNLICLPALASNPGQPLDWSAPWVAV